MRGSPANGFSDFRCAQEEWKQYSPHRTEDSNKEKIQRSSSNSGGTVYCRMGCGLSMVFQRLNESQQNAEQTKFIRPVRCMKEKAAPHDPDRLTRQTHPVELPGT